MKPYLIIEKLTECGENAERGSAVTMRENLGTVLPLACIWFRDDGSIDHVTAHYGDTALTLFIEEIAKGRVLFANEQGEVEYAIEL